MNLDNLKAAMTRSEYIKERAYVGQTLRHYKVSGDHNYRTDLRNVD